MKKRDTLMVVAIIFAAANLRAPITAVGPLIASMKESYPMQNGIFGLITTIPLIMFALFAPVASALSHRLGIGRTMMLSLVIAGQGIILRSYAGIEGLFIGTVFLGCGIAFGNVLIPGIIKARFPERVETLTSVFTISMSVFAATASAVSYPLSQVDGAGWKNSLAFWMLPLIFAFAAWWPQRKLTICGAGASSAAEQKKKVCRSPLAWWMTVLMGAQSCLFYFFTAWLPTILQAKGMEPTAAGYVTFSFQVMTIPASLIVPAVVVRLNNQKGLTTIIAAVYAVSVGLLIFAKTQAMLTILSMICGLCTGSCFSLCMLLLGLRTKTAERATSLSGMVQSGGYAMGALGPILAG
jgi:CP family cyanate transporter-like MFS transporter